MPVLFNTVILLESVGLFDVEKGIISSVSGMENICNLQRIHT